MEICTDHNLSGLIFRIARTAEEKEAVIRCRWKGYKKYFSTIEACRDRHDKYATHYMCIDTNTNEICGCLRMINKLDGPLELEEFFDISDWMENDFVPAELTRFSVPNSNRSLDIKFGLWKLVYLDAKRRDVTHFFVWVRKGAIRDYLYLNFQMYPKPNSFSHGRLHGHIHFNMFLDLRHAAQDIEKSNHPHYGFFCEISHSNIILD
jgi:hypothetical protein